MPFQWTDTIKVNVIATTQSIVCIAIDLSERTLVLVTYTKTTSVYPKKYAPGLCFVVVIHWLIFPYPSGLLHGHCGNLTITPVPAKQPWWILINTSCEFIMNDCITTTKQSTTKPCAYFLGYTVRTYHLEMFHCRTILVVITTSVLIKGNYSALKISHLLTNHINISFLNTNIDMHINAVY